MREDRHVEKHDHFKQLLRRDWRVHTSEQEQNQPRVLQKVTLGSLRSLLGTRTLLGAPGIATRNNDATRCSISVFY